MIRHGRRSELSNDLKAILDRAGFFYSKNYDEYICSQGHKPMYLYDSDFVLLIILKKRGVFRFADLPVENYRYSEGDNADERAFLDQCFSYMKDLFKLHWVNPPYTSARFRETPTECIRVPYGNHIVDLAQEEEAIWNAFDSANRNRIRKAEKSGVEVRSGGSELLDDFYRLDQETRARSSLGAVPKSFYENQLRYFPGNIKIVVSYYEGKPQGACFNYHDTSACYYMYAASAAESETGAMNLLIWRIIQKIRSENYRMFSFVGARINPDPESKYQGINRFKSRFSKHVEACFLFKVIFDIRMYKLYDQIKRLNGKLRKQVYAEDIVDQEIGKWISLNDTELLKAVYGDRILKTVPFRKDEIGTA